ncbi:hypothetical protein LTR53_006991 [Teratosphaeriaceae sp. CCFEE 6253]|nr:hypothetical protein LTR53_006991 [Teratosphaeriaceae sp. CCFEE 6253]
MALALSAPGINLETPATYSIRLGDSTLKNASTANGWASVRYNYRPSVSGAADSNGMIRAGTKAGTSQLSLKASGKQYGYTGEGSSVQGTYVLILRGEGEVTEAVLEELRSNHVFNLMSAPDEKDTAKLRERFPQLAVADDTHDTQSSASHASEAADPKNPYDYRHFLKAAAVAKAKRPELAPSRSGTATPILHARAASSTPLSRPVKRVGDSALLPQRKRKAPAQPTPDRANPKRSKPGSERQTASESRRAAVTKSATPREAPPKIRVDRKASVRRSSYDDDSGELILENEDALSSHKLPSARSAMAMALNGQLGQGPISLRSAANSPASRVGSHLPDLQDGSGDFEDGIVDSSPEIPNLSRHGEAEDVNEEDEDADVEDLELPSPVTAHKPSISASTVIGGDEDDLDAQLAAAMAEEEAAPAMVQEDEEESEEE